MSLAWSGDFNQSREDELERAMEREDRRAMVDPIWKSSTELERDTRDEVFMDAVREGEGTPAERNFANWNAGLDDHSLQSLDDVLHVEPIQVRPKLSSAW